MFCYTAEYPSETKHLEQIQEYLWDQHTEVVMAGSAPLCILSQHLSILDQSRTKYNKYNPHDKDANLFRPLHVQGLIYYMSCFHSGGRSVFSSAIMGDVQSTTR